MLRYIFLCREYWSFVRISCRSLKIPARITPTDAPVPEYDAQRCRKPCKWGAILDGARCSIRFSPGRDRMTCAVYADGPVGFELFRARHSPPTMLVIDDHRPVAPHVGVQVM